MAQFLPTLPLLPKWTLQARVLWGADKQPHRFELSWRQGLKTHRKAKGQYITSEQRWFEERFAAKPGPWIMSRSALVLHGPHGEVVVPDLCFEHREDGRSAFLEIIGFWRRGSLAARLEQLADRALDGLILAVSRGLAGDDVEDLVDHPRIVWFKNVLPAASVRQKLEEFAVNRGRLQG